MRVGLHHAGQPLGGRLHGAPRRAKAFDTLLKRKAGPIEAWRDEYNRIGPNNSLGYRSPAPEVVAGAPLLRDETLTLQMV